MIESALDQDQSSINHTSSSSESKPNETFQSVVSDAFKGVFEFHESNRHMKRSSIANLMSERRVQKATLSIESLKNSQMRNALLRDSESNLFNLNSNHESSGGIRDIGSSTGKPPVMITNNPSGVLTESGEVDPIGLLKKYKSYGTFGRKIPVGPKFKVNTH